MHSFGSVSLISNIFAPDAGLILLKLELSWGLTGGWHFWKGFSIPSLSLSSAKFGLVNHGVCLVITKTHIFCHCPNAMFIFWTSAPTKKRKKERILFICAMMLWISSILSLLYRALRSFIFNWSSQFVFIPHCLIQPQPYQ